MENLSKNLADADEYPAMMHIHQRCISMLSHLWRIPKGETAIGTATTGSSEAIHLGGMAMKRRWVERRQKEGIIPLPQLYRSPLHIHRLMLVGLRTFSTISVSPYCGPSIRKDIG